MLKVRRRGNTVRVSPLVASKATPNITIQVKDEKINTYEDDELMETTFEKFLKRFSRSSPSFRADMLIRILRECNPEDMKVLYEELPVLHRDFLSIPHKKIVYRILEFLHPKDMVTISTVCKSWRELMMSKDTWFALYTSIGLRSMAPVFYIPDGTAYQNSKRFFSYGNWAHGIFTYREFQAHPLGILCMWFDGKYLATGSSDRTCRVFQIKNSQCIRSFEGHEEAVQAIQFDDEKLVSGSIDKTIKIWSNKDHGELIHTLTQHSGPVTCLRLNGDQLVSGSEDKTVRIWDLSDFFPKNKPTAMDTTLSPSLHQRKSQSAIKVISSPCLRTLHGHESAINCLDVNKDVIISGDIHGYIRVWHLSSGNCINVIGFHPDVASVIHLGTNPTEIEKKSRLILHEPISSIQFSNKRLGVSTLSGLVFLVDVIPPPKRENSLKNFNSHVAWITNPDNLKLSQLFRFQDINTRTTVNKSEGMVGQWVLFSQSDDWRLMSGGSLGYVVVWNHKIGKYLYKLRVASDSLNIKAPGAKLSFENIGGALSNRVGSLASFGKKDKQGLGETRALTGLAFDDSYIIAAGMSGAVFVWEATI